MNILKNELERKVQVAYYPSQIWNYRLKPVLSEINPRGASLKRLLFPVPKIRREIDLGLLFKISWKALIFISSAKLTLFCGFSGFLVDNDVDKINPLCNKVLRVKVLRRNRERQKKCTSGHRPSNSRKTKLKKIFFSQKYVHNYFKNYFPQ